MKKQFKLLGLLLVAGLTFAACSSDDIVKDQNTSGKWTATATVGKALRTQTRALTDDEGSLKVGWAENEKVIVFAKDGTSVGGVVGYLEPNMDGYESGSTVEMIGTLEGNSYAEGDEFFLRFPRSEVNYNGQDGTLETIAELYDYAEGTAKVKAVNGTTVLLEDDSETGGDVKLKSMQAIVKFEFVDGLQDGAVPYDVKTVKISASTLDEPIFVELGEDVVNSEVYIALPMVSEEAAVYTIECTNLDGDRLQGVRSGITMKNGNFYTARIRLQEVKRMPLTFQCKTAGNLVITNDNDYSFSYIKNGGSKVTNNDATITIPLEVGEVVQLFCTTTTHGIPQGEDVITKTTIGGTAECYVYGNVNSLLNEYLYNEITELDDFWYTFCGLFLNYEGLYNHPDYDILLPATILTEGCYMSMFAGCRNMERAPKLPAETLVKDCYVAMFSSCVSLTMPPVLPATTLAEGCYMGMFYGCESLTTSPVLPAETLVANCYNNMFYGCKSLSYVTCLANHSTVSTASECIAEWLNFVPKAGTFVQAAGGGWEAGNDCIPLSWLVVDYE